MATSLDQFIFKLKLCLNIKPSRLAAIFFSVQQHGSHFVKTIQKLKHLPTKPNDVQIPTFKMFGNRMVFGFRCLIFESPLLNTKLVQYSGDLNSELVRYSNG